MLWLASRLKSKCLFFSEDNLLICHQVVLPALEHTSGDVRDPASRLVLELYKKV